MSAQVQLGKAKLEQNFTKKNYFKLEKGETTFRILPPFGENAEKGIWRTYYKVQYGFKDSGSKIFPFQEIRQVNSKTKMVEVETASHLFREQLKGKFEETVSRFKKGEISKEDMKKISDVVQEYNLDSKHYMNVLMLDGRMGLLKMPHKCYEALKVELKKLESKGIDAISSLDDARFFTVTRSGDGRDTIYSVRVATESRDIPGVGQVNIDLKSALNSDVISRISSECIRLTNLYPVLTVEQIEDIVKNGSQGVDRVKAHLESLKPKKDSSVQAVAQASPVQSLPLSEPMIVATSTITTRPMETSVPRTEVKAEVLRPVVAQSLTPVSNSPAPAADNADADLEWLKSIGAVS